MANSPWPLIHAERRAILADVEGFTDEQWQTPSLCPEWSVADAFAHIASTAKTNPPKFFGGMIGAGFNFDKFSAKAIAKELQNGPAAVVADLKANVDATMSPPGPTEAMLGEIVIHTADIRRPLGIAHSYPDEALTRVADFFKKSNALIGAKRRITGLQLSATDVEWTHGSGPTVSGPLLSLILAMTGRPQVLADLTGDGVETLKSRF